MKSRGYRRSTTYQQQDNDSNPTNAALAAGSLGALTGGNNPTVTTCNPSDTTWYCRMSRFFNSFQMIINFIIIMITIIALAFFGLKWYRART